MAARVQAKRVYEPREPADGTRVLVMRLWPRGVRKDRIDVWMRELGAEVPLIKAWKAGKIEWKEFERRYREGLKAPEAAARLKEVAVLVRQGRVTLLCSCSDEARCHRGILKKILFR